MFATSLRRRPSFAPGIQSLQSTLGLRENNLISHDLEIPFDSSTDARTANASSSRRLRVLLLAPSAATEARLVGTFERIARLASLTGGDDSIVVFLLQVPQGSSFVSARQLARGTEEQKDNLEGVHAYSKLQAQLLNHEDIPHIPFLLLNNLEILPGLLKRHITNLSRAQIQQKSAATSFELLQLCTANPPMSQQNAFVFSDIFNDLRDLATTCAAVASAPSSSSPSARAAMSQMSGLGHSGDGFSSQVTGPGATSKLKRLRDLVGDQECYDIVEFWKEEWLID